MRCSDKSRVTMKVYLPLICLLLEYSESADCFTRPGVELNITRRCLSQSKSITTGDFGLIRRIAECANNVITMKDGCTHKDGALMSDLINIYFQPVTAFSSSPSTVSNAKSIPFKLVTTTQDVTESDKTTGSNIFDSGAAHISGETRTSVTDGPSSTQVPFGKRPLSNSTQDEATKPVREASEGPSRLTLQPSQWQEESSTAVSDEPSSTKVLFEKRPLSNSMQDETTESVEEASKGPSTLTFQPSQGQEESSTGLLAQPNELSESQKLKCSPSKDNGSDGKNVDTFHCPFEHNKTPSRHAFTRMSFLLVLSAITLLWIQ